MSNNGIAGVAHIRDHSDIDVWIRVFPIGSGKDPKSMPPCLAGPSGRGFHDAAQSPL